MDLNLAQQTAVAANGMSFLRGPAGTGKTTALQQRIQQLLAQDEPAYTILTIVAELDQRTHYLNALHEAAVGPYADLKIITFTSLAREMVQLFWPLVARPSGFERPYLPPTFLSYDLAQLLMWRLVNDELSGGTYADIRLRPQQIVSQLLDTLNRAALNRFSIAAAIERQISSWTGEPDHIRHLRQVEQTARQFRHICLTGNLLDMSLIIEVFDRHLLGHQEFGRYFSERFRHLLVDNVEEQTPAGQHFIGEMMASTISTTLSYDVGGGYKRFLSADPAAAWRLAERCQRVIDFPDSFIATAPLAELGNLIDRYLVGSEEPVEQAGAAVLGTVEGRYRRDMIEGVADRVALLVERGTPAGEIALLAPYLDGALHFSLTNALKERNIPYYVYRRRSSPREEPRIRAWLTWLALAHPNWGVRPSEYDVAEALALSIAGLDPARAALLAAELYSPATAQLHPGESLATELQERVGLEMVALVDQLREWLLAAGDQHPVDSFLYRLFNDLLARSPYQPSADVAGAAICEWLVATAGRLRETGRSIGLETEAEVGVALIEGINQGLVTSNPPDLGDPPDPDGVMISTAYGFLLSERVVDVQVWLETAAMGWWDIPRQPLSNVFVLAASWEPGRLWTMEEEMRTRNRLLSQVARGLVSRCRRGILLAHNELDRRGQEQDGHLWRALQLVR